jgi:hypothetical protein
MWWCLFISSCINASIANEIHWSTTQERATLSTHLLELLGFIDGTLAEIQKPWKDQGH